MVAWRTPSSLSQPQVSSPRYDQYLGIILDDKTLTFQDRENIDVIAHELAHSWSGNLVTNASWEHFWLNEGWTVYLERRVSYIETFCRRFY
jgi:predicted metalloprotease with PDZ domain